MEDECCSNDRVLKRDKNAELRDCRQLMCLYLDLAGFLGKSVELPKVNVISKKAQRVVTLLHPHLYIHSARLEEDAASGVGGCPRAPPGL